MTLANYTLYYDADDPENPDDIENDGMYQLLMTRLESLTAYESVRSGDVSSMRELAGAPEVETTQWRWRTGTKYEQLKDLFRQSRQFNKEFTNNIFQCIIFP